MDPSLRFIARRKSLSGPAPPNRNPPNPPSRAEPSSAEVTKIVFSQTIGVAALQLGSFVRQRIFSVGVQLTGRSCAAAVAPFELGPRHCGQFADNEPAKTSPNRRDE